MKGDFVHTQVFRTEWKDSDNVFISLHQHGIVQIGIVKVAINKLDNKGEAFISNLYIERKARDKGYGRILLNAALGIAKSSGCKSVALEWDGNDSPQWVLDWYVRFGFEEEEFGQGYELLRKTFQ